MTKKILSRNKNFKEERIQMKSSRNFKVGVILLVIALTVGIFAALALADGNGLKGKGILTRDKIKVVKTAQGAQIME